MIHEAAERLKKGEIVAFPTETVYGLGACIFDAEGVAKIFQAKGRPADNPLIAHICDLAQVEEIAIDIPAAFYTLASHFFPGPLTVVLKRHSNVPPIVSGGLHTIALRMPRHPVAQALIRAVGQPLVAPSANLSGKPSSTTAAHVRADFPGLFVIDGGETEIGIESTVISLIGEPALLRLGAISPESIEDVLGKPLQRPSSESLASSPGTRYKHYAPQAKVLLNANLPATPRRMVVKKVTAADLYAILRKADDEKYDEIVINTSGISDPALLDRLYRAASATSPV